MSWTNIKSGSIGCRFLVKRNPQGSHSLGPSAVPGGHRFPNVKKIKGAFRAPKTMYSPQLSSIIRTSSVSLGGRRLRRTSSAAAPRAPRWGRLGKITRLTLVLLKKPNRFFNKFESLMLKKDNIAFQFQPCFFWSEPLAAPLCPRWLG